MSEVKDLVLINSEDVIAVRERSRMLKQFIVDELKSGVDYGKVFKTAKESLYKPGAEKLAKLFRLGSRIINKTENLDHEKRFFIVSYTIQVFQLDTNQVISECEGSANSQEKKYSSQNVYEIINTLQKMAQKRAFVGAIISAVGASEFYTQDLEDTTIERPETKIHYDNTKVKIVEIEKKPEMFPWEKEETFDNASKKLANELCEAKTLREHNEIKKSLLEDYEIPLGKLKGKKLSEVPKDELNIYMIDIKLKLKRADFPEEFRAQTQDIVYKIEEYLHDSQHSSNEKS